jgi:hypothetical protein
MKTNKIKCAGIAVMTSVLCFTGCDKPPRETGIGESPGVGEKAGAALDKAAGKAADATKSAASATKELTGKALDKTGEILEKAGAAVENTGESMQQ